MELFLLNLGVFIMLWVISIALSWVAFFYSLHVVCGLDYVNKRALLMMSVYYGLMSAVWVLITVDRKLVVNLYNFHARSDV